MRYALFFAGLCFICVTPITAQGPGGSTATFLQQQTQQQLQQYVQQHPSIMPTASQVQNRNQNQNQNTTNTQNNGESSRMEIMNQENFGQQLETLTKEQQTAQKQAQDELKKVDGQSNIVKFFVGPDHQAINNLKKITEANRVAITQLKQIQVQSMNMGDNTALQNAIQTLEKQNVALEEKIAHEEGVFNLFGWILKYFSK